jgi:hypothetical protein
MHVQFLTRRVQACLIAALCSFGSGCVSMAGLQDLHYSTSNKYRACEAWKCSFTKEQRKVCSEDFEQGFKQGYYDTAMGKDCRLPPVAPPQYWSARYQSCSGQCEVQDWFRGYQNGIAAAQSSGCSGFNEVPVSPGAPVINKTGCGTCYSPDPCNCNAQEVGDAYSHSVISSRENAPPKTEATSGERSNDPMVDLPSAIAIVPASYGQIGLIGGYGLQNAD